LKKLRALLSLETALPIGGGDLGEAAEAFFLVPAVDLLEGLLISLVLLLLISAHINIELSSALYVALHMLLTGGLHMDGFSDYIDGIASRKRGEELLKVIKDPRRGSFAAAWVSIAMLLSYASLSALLSLKLSPASLLALLSSAYISSGESMFLTAAFGAEEPYEGMSKMFAESAKKMKLLNAIAYAILAIPLVAADLRAIALLIAIPFIGLAVALDAERRLGFVNGDVLGFSFEAARCSALVVSAVLLSLA